MGYGVIAAHVFLVLLLVYLIKEAWENYHDKRWPGVWLDVALIVPIAAYLVYRMYLAAPIVADLWRHGL